MCLRMCRNGARSHRRHHHTKRSCAGRHSAARWPSSTLRPWHVYRGDGQRFSPPSGGCRQMAWREGDGPRLAAWPAWVPGAATTPRWRPPAAASGDEGAPRARSIFGSIGRAAAGRNAGCMMLWSQGHATWRARELERELWRPWEWSVAIGQALLCREKELCACMSPRHECVVLPRESGVCMLAVSGSRSSPG